MHPVDSCIGSNYDCLLLFTSSSLSSEENLHESSSSRRQPSDSPGVGTATPREGTKKRNQGKESESLGFPADICDVRPGQ